MVSMQQDRQETILAKQEASEMKVKITDLCEAKWKYEERKVEWKDRIRYAPKKRGGR